MSQISEYEEMRAGNAFLSAGVLNSAGMQEGFRREASLALELIAKAAIAQRLQVGEDLGIITKVPASHNVPQLWAQAKLPALSPEDQGRLVRARVWLMWAGRYPAPNNDAAGERDEADIREHAYDRTPGNSLFRKPHSFTFANVERIFAIAQRCFFDIRKAHG